jgi:hypothetical protein
MTYLWERHNKKTGERAYFLQFFDDDDMYPVDKSIATQILAVYKTWKVDPRVQGDAEKPNIVTTLYEVDGDVPIIVQKIRAESDDEKYRIKFSKEGDYVNLDTDFIFMFQQACKMIPFDVENVKYGRIEYMAYQVVPKKVGCIKLE